MSIQRPPFLPDRDASRTGNLSDADRRARAEAAMRQVMALMPDESDNDDDDEET